MGSRSLTKLESMGVLTWGREVGILQEDNRDSKVESVVHDVVRRRDLAAGKFEGPRVVSKCGAGACRSSRT
jgi:hypothetical protein